jgi:CheY-like chemotaxis protein/anti-sigma regulatory factor (Ser/Thr protein kinase)
LTINLARAGAAARISGDPDRLQQVFWNLLSNAVKFTPNGGRVDVHLQPTPESFTITVTDTGVGIDPAFLPFVFERFRQADSTSTRQHSGMGLGLAIVRHVVELHGGSVSAESEGEGRGARFTVTLPRLTQSAAALGKTGTPPAAADAQSRLAPIRVLLVEDDPDAREVTAAGLTKSGFEVHAVSGALKALELLDVWLPDVVVSDIGMPGMDGYEFVRLLRARSPERGGKVAALALTAFAGLGDAARAHASGYQEHVSKPITPDALAEAIVALKKRQG